MIDENRTGIDVMFNAALTVSMRRAGDRSTGGHHLEGGTTMVKEFTRQKISKRTVLKGMGAGVAVLAAPAIVRAQTAQPDEIKIGSLCVLTGPGAVFGTSARNAFTLRAEQVNKAGGLWGNGKGMIKLVIADDQSKPEIAVSELARLARDKDIAVLPSVIPSGSTFQATIEAERQRISYVNMGATSTEIQSRGLKYTFSMCNDADGIVKAYLDYTKELVEKSGKIPKRVALVYENKYGGPSSQRAWMRFFSKTVNWNLAGDYPYDPATSDFGPLIARLKAEDIDFPVISGYPQDTILLIRAMREQNYNPLAISGFNGIMPNIELIDGLGKAAEYIMGQAPFLYTLPAPGAKEFIDAYKAKVGKLPDAIAGQSYNGFNGVLAAIKRSKNPLDRDAVRESIASLDIAIGNEGIIIPDGIRMAANGGNPISVGGYFQIRNGVHATVLPAKYATTEVVYPRPDWDKI